MPQRTCGVSGCANPHRARGLCSTHYNEQQYGSARHRKPATCEHCAQAYEAQRKGQRFCSLLCRDGGNVSTATPAARTQWREHRRRRRAQEHTTERFADAEIYERDQWRCGVCLRQVKQSLRWPDRMSASLDHVVPLAEGGTHTRANVRLTHLTCNNRRGARGGGEQLALIG